MSSKKILDDNYVEKKFENLTSSSEVIQNLSHWALSHKSHHEKIVSIWFKVLKKSKIEHRLLLLYFCNEVVQTCKKKHALIFKDAFKEILKDAALLVRDSSVRKSMEKIFKLWRERKIYHESFINDLIAVLNNTKVKSSLNSKLLADFHPRQMMDGLVELTEMEAEVEEKRMQLKHGEVTSVNQIKVLLKDRRQGEREVEDLKASLQDYRSYVTSLQVEIDERSKVMLTLEQCQIFLDAQKGECSILSSAYRNYHQKLLKVKKALYEKINPGLTLHIEQPTYKKKKKKDVDNKSNLWPNFNRANCEGRDDSLNLNSFHDHPFNGPFSTFLLDRSELDDSFNTEQQSFEKNAFGDSDVSLRTTSCTVTPRILPPTLSNQFHLPPTVTTEATTSRPLNQPPTSFQFFQSSPATSSITSQPPLNTPHNQPSSYHPPTQSFPQPSATQWSNDGSSTPVLDEDPYQEYPTYAYDRQSYNNASHHTNNNSSNSFNSDKKQVFTYEQKVNTVNTNLQLQTPMFYPTTPPDLSKPPPPSPFVHPSFPTITSPPSQFMQQQLPLLMPQNIITTIPHQQQRIPQQQQQKNIQQQHLPPQQQHITTQQQKHIPLQQQPSQHIQQPHLQHHLLSPMQLNTQQNIPHNRKNLKVLTNNKY